MSLIPLLLGRLQKPACTFKLQFSSGRSTPLCTLRGDPRARQKESAGASTAPAARRRMSGGSSGEQTAMWQRVIQIPTRALFRRYLKATNADKGRATQALRE